MYTIEDLFDKRQVVGAKLEKLLTDKSYTKSKFCKDAGISRPTLDKLLTGSLTNQTNFEKHMTKILCCLALTPDMLLGNTCNQYIQANIIKKAMRISSEQISQATDIPLSRLTEIESGAEASTAELRDLALCLSTSVRGLLGTGYFGTQIATLEGCLGVYSKDAPEGLGGFWGHIGILPANRDDFLWYPITGETRKWIYQTQNQDFMVIPCMNNRLLFLNMKNINEIMLLDDACDPPYFTNWDYHVDCGGTPLVIYEALEDYFYGEEDEISPVFREVLENLTKEKEWTEDDLNDLTSQGTYYFKDGRIGHSFIDFDDTETISDEIYTIYEFTDPDLLDPILFWHDLNGAEFMLNMNNVSVLDLPLLKIENAICEDLEEMSPLE